MDNLAFLVMPANANDIANAQCEQTLMPEQMISSNALSLKKRDSALAIILAKKIPQAPLSAVLLASK